MNVKVSRITEWLAILGFICLLLSFFSPVFLMIARFAGGWCLGAIFGGSLEERVLRPRFESRQERGR